MRDRRPLIRRERRGCLADELHFLKIGGVVAVILMILLPILFAGFEAPEYLGGWP